MSHSAREWLLQPAVAALGEDGVEVAFKQSTGVLEVLFGVGFGGGDAGKRFVQDAHDPPLFGKRGHLHRKCPKLLVADAWHGGSIGVVPHQLAVSGRAKHLAEIERVCGFRRANNETTSATNPAGLLLRYDGTSSHLNSPPDKDITLSKHVALEFL